MVINPSSFIHPATEEPTELSQGSCRSGGRLGPATARLTWITAGYGWISIVAPMVIASPAYFSGRLSFGEVMVVVGGFYQVNQSLRWFVDNFALLAEWRAALSRVIKFREVLQMSESGCEDAIPMPFGGVKPVNPAALRPFRTSAQTSGSR